MRALEAIKTKNIIRIGADETLTHALSTLSSSHDAAFVFSDDPSSSSGQGKKLLGIINPYHSLIKSSNPGNAKVEHCLFHPPRVQNNMPISRVARLMMESKIHYLPVMENGGTFMGIVSARKLLSVYRDSSVFNTKIGDVIKNKKRSLVTVYEDDVISHALNIFKKHKVSKLVVIHKNMKLAGVLSYYDLINFLVAPRQKEGKGDKVGTRVKFNYHRVRNFAKTQVLTMTSDHTMKEALLQILDREIGSVVVIDRENHPYGIITTQDLLQLLSKQRQKPTVEVVDRNLSLKSLSIVGGFVKGLTGAVAKVPGIVAARLMVKEEKRGGVFKAALSLIPRAGEPKVIKREGKNLVEVLKRIKVR